MSVKITGLAEIQANIEQIAKQKVKKASVQAVNSVAKKARKNALKKVAKDIGVPVKILQGRVRSQKAKGNTPVAKLRVNRSNMPLIRLLESPRNKIWEGRGGIMVGKYAVQRGFKQRLKNGRTHIMQRAGKARYAIDVVKIPLSQPLTNAFHNELKDYPTQIQAELRRQLLSVLGS